MAPQSENVVMEGVRLIWRNFSGKEGQYNREGDRNFNVVLPEDTARQMLEDGWNVKYKEPREEGDEGLWTLAVSVNFKGRPPRVVMITSRGRTNLSEDECPLLDWVDTRNVDLIIRPYHWNIKGKTGVKAYMQSIYVTIQEDYLELKYNDVPEIEAIEAREELPALNRGSQEQDATDDIVDAEIVGED